LTGSTGLTKDSYGVKSSWRFVHRMKLFPST
jgi:hypothetical protein